MRIIPFVFLLISATPEASERTYNLGVCEPNSQCRSCIETHQVVFRLDKDEQSINVYKREHDSQSINFVKKLANCNIQSASDWTCIDGRAQVFAASGNVTMEFLGQPIKSGSGKYIGCLTD